MKTRTLLNSLALSTIGLGLVAGLSGCFNPLQAVTDQVAQNAAESVIENATGTDISLEGGTIPDTWPADVPRPSGKVLAVWCETSAGCSGSFEISDRQAGYEDYVSQLLAAGYTQSMDLSTGDASMGVFENGTTSVTASGSTDSTSSTGAVLVVITTPMSSQ